VTQKKKNPENNHLKETERDAESRERSGREDEGKEIKNKKSELSVYFAFFVRGMKNLF